jgi:penicillin-binding protein 1A
MNASSQARSDSPPPLSLLFRSPRAYARASHTRIGARLAEGGGTRRATFALLAVAGLAVLFLFWWLYLIVATPSVGELREARYAQATLTLTADGEELTRYSTKNRKWVALDSISTHLTDALVATEDRRFYEHAGIDVKRTAGAILQTATGDVQGGSTITMQLARNAFPEFQNDFILTRKFKEWLTAIHIEDLYAKEEVLEMYLNTVPFLYNAFGIEAGAQTYFGKPAVDVNVPEAATLIAMLKGPAYYNPRQHPERARERRNVVLRLMADAGYLDESKYERFSEEDIALNFDRVSYDSDQAPYFAEHLRGRLQEWAEEAGYNLYTSGLRVHTTLDSRMQEAAETAVTEMGDRLQGIAESEWGGASFPAFWNENSALLDRFVEQSSRFERLTAGGASADSARALLESDAGFLDSLKAQQHRLEAGFLALDPTNGHVKAWVGGRDFDRTKYDHIAQARRQPGSTFKPFVYAAALEAGFSPDDRIRDKVRTYEMDGAPAWSPENFGGASGRMMRMRDGLAQSKNTITAKLMMEVGPEKVADLAHRMGIESELEAVPSLALGTSPVRLLELAGAYTTIADQGTHHAPVTITRIEDRDGQVVERFGGEEREGLEASVAYTLLDMMRGVVDGGTGARIRSSYGAQGDLAGKTGTTQNGADGWFMLMHPKLIMGSWVGFNTSALHFRSQYWGQGSHTALPIVGRFYQQVDLPDASFEPPPGYDGPAQSTRASSERDSLESQSVADSLTRAARGDSLDADSTGTDSTGRETTPTDSLNRGSREENDGEGRTEEPPPTEQDTLDESTDDAPPADQNAGQEQDETEVQEEDEQEEQGGQNEDPAEQGEDTATSDTTKTTASDR